MLLWYYAGTKSTHRDTFTCPSASACASLQSTQSRIAIAWLDNSRMTSNLRNQRNCECVAFYIFRDNFDESKRVSILLSFRWRSVNVCCRSSRQRSIRYFSSWCHSFVVRMNASPFIIHTSQWQLVSPPLRIAATSRTMWTFVKARAHSRCSKSSTCVSFCPVCSKRVNNFADEFPTSRNNAAIDSTDFSYIAQILF